MPRRATHKEFLDKAKIVHGDKYSYEKVKYVNNKVDVTITCKIHGDFNQRPDKHVNSKAGCQKCGVISSATSRNKTTEIFIQEAKAIHGERYVYENTKYFKSKKKVTIGCKIHGDFEQMAGGHLQGKGCPQCSFLIIGWSKTDFYRRCLKNNNGLGVLYLIRCYDSEESFYKLGVSSSNVAYRYNGNLKMPYNYEVIKELKLDPDLVYDMENQMISSLAKYKYNPNIHFNGRTECFSKLEPILKLLDKLLEKAGVNENEQHIQR